MQRGWDSELIFPIRDAASADCLHTAGVISESDKECVYSRARTFLDDAILKEVAFSEASMS
jgi:hypothetical protein